MILETIKQTLIYALLIVTRTIAPSSIPNINKRIEIQELILGACHGNPDDQYNVGVQYTEWNKKALRETGKETRSAIKWFKLASEQGKAKASYELGYLYLHGKNTEISKHNILRNPYKGLELMEKSAYQGDDRAQYVVGMMYRKGDIALKDKEKGKEWIWRAFSALNYDAVAEMAVICRENNEEKLAKTWEKMAKDKEAYARDYKGQI